MNISTQEQSDESTPLAKNENTIDLSLLNSDETIKISNSLKWITFVFLSSVTLFSNIDSGVIPAATQKMEDQMKVAETKLGLFGSMDFFGRVIGSLAYIPIIIQINRKIFVNRYINRRIYILNYSFLLSN